MESITFNTAKNHTIFVKDKTGINFIQPFVDKTKSILFLEKVSHSMNSDKYFAV
jgi:hypothetical protein